MPNRRINTKAIGDLIAARSETVTGIEKAAGLQRGELKAFLHGDDMDARSLAAISGLLGVSASEFFMEED